MHLEWLKWAFQFFECHTYKGGKFSLGNMPSNYTKKIGVGLRQDLKLQLVSFSLHDWVVFNVDKFVAKLDLCPLS